MNPCNARDSKPNPRKQIAEWVPQTTNHCQCKLRYGSIPVARIHDFGNHEDLQTVTREKAFLELLVAMWS